MSTTRSETPQGSELVPDAVETPTSSRPTQDLRRVTLSSSPSSPRTSTIPRRLLLPIIGSSVSMYNNSSSASSTTTRLSSTETTAVDLNTTTSQGNLLSSPTTTHRLPLSRSRSRSRDDESNISTPPTSPVMYRGHSFRKVSAKAKILEMNSKSRTKSAQKENDSMIYLDGPQIYTCNQCRTHFTSHDDIISKSFHGRHGRAYLFDQCVNVNVGPPEDRHLMTGLHGVCDIFCKRCKHLVGWTYAKAYESSQKYKEGKFIIEKINLHMDESDYYDVDFPAGERRDRWRIRSMSWGSDKSLTSPRRGDSDMVYEYKPCNSPYLSSTRSIMDTKKIVKTPPPPVRTLPPPPSL